MISHLLYCIISLYTNQPKIEFLNFESPCFSISLLFIILNQKTCNTPAPEHQAIHIISTPLDFLGRVCLSVVKTLKDKTPSSIQLKKDQPQLILSSLSHPRFHCLQVPFHPCSFSLSYPYPFPQECYFCVIFPPHLPAKPCYYLFSSRIGIICRGR